MKVLFALTALVIASQASKSCKNKVVAGTLIPQVVPQSTQPAHQVFKKHKSRKRRVSKKVPPPVKEDQPQPQEQQPQEQKPQEQQPQEQQPQEQKPQEQQPQEQQPQEQQPQEQQPQVQSPQSYSSNPPLTQEEQACLDAHNNERKRVGVPPLTWSSTLQQSALAYAQVLVQQGCGLVHSSTQYGENLAQGLDMPHSVTDLFLTEGMPNYAAGEYNHYGQCVWRGTTQVGCARCGDCDIVVCHYDPPGNYIGQDPLTS